MAKMLFHCTHGKEDPERATLPFILGNVAAPNVVEYLALGAASITF